MLSKAQSSMSLSDALSLALKNNYAILLAKDSATLAKNNNTFGNAGGLPNLGLNGGMLLSNNSIFENSGSSTQTVSGIKIKSYTADIALNWILFNGLKPFATKGRLNQLAHQGELSLRSQIENTIRQVMLAYYNLIRAEQALKVTLQTISIDEERIKIAETKFKIGSGNKIDFLQAKVDRNQQESQYLSQKIGIDSAKIFLNQLLVRDKLSPIQTTDTTISIQFQPSWEALLDSSENKNTSLKSAKTIIRINQYLLKERRADLSPILMGSAAYNYSFTQNPLFIPYIQRTLGPALGLTLSWNIFNGSISKIKVENAKINLDRAQINYQNQYSLLVSNLYFQFLAFQNGLQVLHLEEENIVVAKENLQIALEKYRLGASTQLDLMTAEQSLENSLNRLVQARFNAKSLEINLLQLSGGLIH